MQPEYKLQDLHKLINELEVLEETYNTNKIVFFRPLPKGDQRQFFSDSTATVRLVLGSNRSGKTVESILEAAAHSLGFRPWLDKDHPDYIVRLPNGEPIPVPNVGRIAATNYQQAVKQTIWPKICEWWPMHLIKKVHRDQRGIPVQIDWKNGSTVFIMSYTQERMAFEGTSGHWAYCDEPPPYYVYIGLKRGLVDFGGHMWLAMTPLAQPWIMDVIVERANVKDSGVKMYKFSIWDNCVENGGYLTREAIEEFLADTREDELEARLHANFLHLAGRVFKDWMPEPPYWVDEADFPLKDTWPRVCVIDPHPRKPIAVLWAACNPDNQWIVYRTLFDRKLKTVKEVSDRIKELERDGGDAPLIAHRIIDSSSKVPERTSGTNIFKKFWEEDIRCAMANKKNTDSGYDAIHEAIRMKNEWDEPRLVVFNTCVPVKQNFENFCYDEWQTDRMRDLKGDKQEYRKTHDDFIDGIRYIFQSGITYMMLKTHARKKAEDDDFQVHNGLPLDMSGLNTGYDRRNF